MIENNIIIELY